LHYASSHEHQADTIYTASSYLPRTIQNVATRATHESYEGFSMIAMTDDTPHISALSARLRWLLVPHRLALLGIALLAVFFNFWMLGQNGYGNQYYTNSRKIW
jgi:hypothetical protein